MRNFSLHFSLSLAAALTLLFCLPLAADPPPAKTDANSSSSQSARSKPQVIYHLPRSSTYSATLHSQAKTQNNLLPVDGQMPTSLQLSRSAANAEALEARQEAERTATPPADQNARQQKQTIKRSRLKTPAVRTFAPGRGKSHGNPHPGKGRKK